ncbi:hypothetical protein [Pontibacter korlensis]|uniref:hypothetical protein n=1 Tax=Pontibacter korlensis TaxID=400092 RepID=UPI0011DD99C3|nr:hypothetical protein [Pontibacter korlensis]
MLEKEMALKQKLLYKQQPVGSKRKAPVVLLHDIAALKKSIKALRKQHIKAQKKRNALKEKWA